DAPPKDAPKQGEKDVALTKTDDGIPLPAGALHRFGNRQARHPDGINGSVVSPDGKYLATLGASTVIVWDVQTLVAKCVLRNQNVAVSIGDAGARAAFLPDSKHLLVALHPGNRYYIQSDRTPKVDVARVFDVETGKQKFALQGEADYWA